MGPVWDFDLSAGNYGHLDESLRGPEGFYISLFEKNKFFYFLMNNDTFKTHLKARWKAIYDDVVLKMLDDIYQIQYDITCSRYHNFNRWDIIGKDDEWYTTPEILAQDTYQKQILFLYHFLSQRIDWLDQEIRSF